MHIAQYRNIELPTDILIKPYTVHILGGLLLLSTLHKGRLPALLTIYFTFKNGYVKSKVVDPGWGPDLGRS